MIKIRNSLNDDILQEYKSNKIFLAVLFVIVLVFFSILIVFTQIFIAVITQGPSMEPNLHTGDVLVINTVGNYTYGDIIVVDKGDKWVVKRVIGLDGDMITIENGYVYRNYQKLEEDYIKEQKSTRPFNDNVEKETVMVKDGYVYYLGDNRKNSTDSRFDGACKKEKVVGVVENWSKTFVDVTYFMNKLLGKI